MATESFSNGPIVCPVRLLTGIPCPACGTTRSVGCILLGKFDVAWQLNPAGYLVFIATAIWTLKLSLLKHQLAKYSAWFNRLQLYLKASIVVGIYLIAWVTTLMRWNTAIF